MAGLLEIDEFRRELLRALRRAVPAEWISLNDIGPDPSTIVALVDPAMSPGQHETFAAHAHQNPLVERIARTRDGRARRFSDVIGTAELHGREIYTELYGPIGLEHQIAFTLPHDQDRILGVALSRTAASGDFSDGERDLLDESRPFLIQAYRNAVRYSTLLAARGRTAAAPLPDRRRLEALGLTARQGEVLQLLATGVGEREIAARLGISQRTVQKHLQHCYRRLGVRDRSQAGAIAWSTLG